MKKRPVLIRAFTIILIVFFSKLIQAQEDISVINEPYEVFYSAFNTSFLTPEVAGAIDIVRAKDRALVNISVIETLESGKTQSVIPFDIKGTTFNLIHRKEMEFQLVKEKDAAYYLGKFKIANNDEIIVIDIDVTPRQGEQPININFRKRFYHN